MVLETIAVALIYAFNEIGTFCCKKAQTVETGCWSDRVPQIWPWMPNVSFTLVQRLYNPKLIETLGIPGQTYVK